MAGEPMTTLQFKDKHTGEIVSYNKIKGLFNKNDKKEIDKWINFIQDDNYYSAVNWCR